MFREKSQIKLFFPFKAPSNILRASCHLASFTQFSALCIFIYAVNKSFQSETNLETNEKQETRQWNILDLEFHKNKHGLNFSGAATYFWIFLQRIFKEAILHCSVDKRLNPRMLILQKYGT